MTVEVTQHGTMVVTGEHVEAYRLLALRAKLKLETVGLKSRAPVAPLIREILQAANYEAPRKKTALLGHYEYYLKRIGVLQ